MKKYEGNMKKYVGSSEFLYVPEEYEKI